VEIQFIDLKSQYQAAKKTIDARIQSVLDHGQYIMGPEVRELESSLESYTGAKHCVTVASGTEALLISMMALGIGRGHEVVTTPFTFAATAETIILLGATPVFVDIEQDTCNIDPRAIEAAITDRTKAIIPVSLYGQVCDMDEINAIADRNGRIPVIEDAAQSFGAMYKNRKSCNLSTIACTSFFPSKPLGCYGDGGAIFTDDDRLALAMREIRIHGQGRRYHHTRVGVGGRMDTLQCAIVLAKLERLDWELEQRSIAGARYLDMLKKSRLVDSPVVRSDCASVWGQFTVQVPDRDRVVEELQAMKIPVAVHYPIPLHRQLAYEGKCRRINDLVVAEAVAKRVLSLPMHAYIDVGTQQQVIAALERAVR
jgi:UDP-2-acetamido-2-deoxy-ribo-hexuluronate aminotransferase